MKNFKIGDKIYVDSSYYLSHGSDDFTGGIATISDIKDGFVYIVERPGYGYNLDSLLDKQDKLKKEFKNNKAHASPDIDTPWIQNGDTVNGEVYRGKDIW